MKKKWLSVLLSVAMISTLFTGCGSAAETPVAGETAEEEAEDAAEASTEDAENGQNMADADVDISALAGTKIAVYTHGGNRVLGEEKKDEDGNTYRDESSAWLAQLAERFTADTGIEVELNVVTNEEEIEPLFKVQDASVDVFTPPNWSLAQWEAYSEPYCTVAEASEIYGADYTGSMPNNGTDVFSIMPAKAYNQCVVYNEEVIKAAGYDEIPATLEAFNEMCAAIRDMGVTPISMHRVENWPLATVQDFAGYVVGNPNVLAECLREEFRKEQIRPSLSLLRLRILVQADMSLRHRLTIGQSQSSRITRKQQEPLLNMFRRMHSFLRTVDLSQTKRV